MLITVSPQQPLYKAFFLSSGGGGCLVAQPCSTLRDPVAVIHQAPQSMRSFRQEYWSGWPFPSPGNLPNPGIKLVSFVGRQIVDH